MRAAKVQVSLRIRAVSPEPSLLGHTSSESRGTFRQKARSLAPLNDWACAVGICHDGMLEDTNSPDGAQMVSIIIKILKHVPFPNHFVNCNNSYAPNFEKLAWAYCFWLVVVPSICACIMLFSSPEPKAHKVSL